MKRTHFPSVGIYRARNLVAHYLTPADARRYRYVQPARQMDREQAAQCWLADCWIVDADGNRNPGTIHCPVPIRLDSIGERVDFD